MENESKPKMGKKRKTFFPTKYLAGIEGEGEEGEGENFGGGGRRGYESGEEEEKEERFGGHEELLFYLSVFDRLIVSNIELIYIDNI